MKTNAAFGLATFALLFAFTQIAIAQGPKHSLRDDIRGLYSPSPESRARASARLVEAGPAAIPSLKSIVCGAYKSDSDVAWREAAKAVGQLKAEDASLCLVRLLARDPTLNVFASEETIIAYDPAYAALLQIGEPAIPSISMALLSLHPDQAFLGLRILQKIGTPEAKAAVEAYIEALENQTKLAKGVLSDFPRENQGRK